MMNKTIKYSLTLLAAALLTGCSADDGESAATDGGQMPIRVSMAGVGQETRATGTGHLVNPSATTTVFKNNRKVDLFLLEAGNVESNPHLWHYDGETPYFLNADGTGIFGWYLDRDRLIHTARHWSPTENSLFFYAWYPAGVVPAIDVECNFTVPEDQGAIDGDADCDLLFAIPRGGNPVAPTPEAVPLTFNHCLAKVEVTFVCIPYDGDVADKTNASSVTLGNDDILLKADIDPLTGQVTTDPEGTQGSVTLKSAGLVALSPSASTPHYCVIPPQTLTGKAVTVTNERGTASFVIPQKDGEDVVAQSGRVYRLTLNVSQGKPIGLSVSVSPWTEEPTIAVPELKK